MKQLLKKILRKGLQIELEDKYCYPNSKEFVKPDTNVVKTAIETYFAKNDETIEFVSLESPITFVANGKEKYTATLKFGYGRYNHGYYVHCLEVIEESPV